VHAVAALEFGNGRLSAIRSASLSEFPDLAAKLKVPLKPDRP